MDISAERRAATGCDAPANVRFEHADAQAHAFPPASFTLAFSRYGTMFFTDPAAAFANIGRALRPGARFVHLGWQGSDRQEWVTETRHALAAGAPVAGDESAFPLDNPVVVTDLLTTTGFTGVQVEDVSEPLRYGGDPIATVDAVFPHPWTRDVLDHLSGADRARALAHLHAVMTAHHTRDGVWFGPRSWLVTARRGGG